MCLHMCVSGNSMSFHLKIDAFFIHIQTTGLDLILSWKWCNYFAEFENVFMCLMTYFFANTKDILFKIYFKSLVFSKQNAVVLRFDIVSDKSFSVTPVFTTLILLPLFLIIKTPQCCGFTFINFFFFLLATNVLVTS